MKELTKKEKKEVDKITKKIFNLSCPICDKKYKKIKEYIYKADCGCLGNDVLISVG